MQDIEIARNTKLDLIQDVVKRLGIRGGICRLLWKNKSKNTKQVL